MGKNTQGVWVLSENFNDYDQHGPVTRCIWQIKPTIEQLVSYFKYDTGQSADVMGALEFILHVLNGGGRRGAEYSWYDLHFVEFAKRID